MARILGAAEFKATCLRIIKQMGRDGEPVTITNRGRPVAILSPAPASGSIVRSDCYRLERQLPGGIRTR